MKYIKRNLTVQIDDIAISEPAKIKVTCTKENDGKTPDFCDVTLYNLSENIMSKIVESKRILVTAGHNEVESKVFLGDIQAVTTKKTQNEWVTKIIAGDGATALAQSIINKTYKKPISAKTMIEDIARTSKLSKKTEFIDVGDEKGTLRGTSVTGKASSEIDRLCRARDWNWSIQNETLTVCKNGSSRKNEAYRIAVDSGMIGSPEWINTGTDLRGKKPKDGFKIKVEALAIPSVRPNDKIRIETFTLMGKIGSFVYRKDVSDPLNDVFIVDKVRHDLDSREGNFRTTLECSKV
jgi:hypothetical protein